MSPTNYIDLTGRVFFRLTVLERDLSNKKATYWVCKCSCGETRVVDGRKLREGKTKSCGCWKASGAHKIKHGRSGTSEYNIWFGMKQRCYDKNTRVYPLYGGRGITICDEWLNSFEEFFNDMGEKPSSKHSLDRIDNSLGYSPSNCRWATQAEQANNTRSNHLLLHNGKELTLSQWEKVTGISQYALCKRIKRGWSAEKALTTPLDLKRSSRKLA